MIVRRERRSAPAAAFAFLMLSACGHSDPMRETPPVSTDPVRPGPPVQLTLNSGIDGEAAILGTSTVIYSFELADTRERDRCLGLLPVSGGTRFNEVCAQSAPSRDSTDAYRWPTPIAPDSVVWFRTSRPIGSDFDREATLVASALSARDGVRVLQSYPIRSSSGALHLEPASLRVMSDGRLVYVGMRYFQLLECDVSGCDNRLVWSGREVALLDPRQPGTPPAVVAGTDYASSVTSGPAPGDIVYTLAGDARVFLRNATGGVSVLHDFTAAGIARDVHLANGRLVAVVGGAIDTVTNSFGELTQEDWGGTVIVVNLSTGQETPVADSLLQRRPVLTPDGRHVVVEFQGNLYRHDLQ